MPAHAVVAEPREELEDWVVGPQLAALREAADGKYVSVEAPCVALVASVLADAGDEALGRAPVLVLCQVRPTRFVYLYDTLGGFGSTARVQMHRIVGAQ